MIGVKKAIYCSRIRLVIRDHQDLEFLFSQWNVSSHTFVAVWGEFAPMLEDVLNLLALALYKEANTKSVPFV